MKAKYNNRIVAVEIINAGKCNMDCAYCYIPKSEEMNKLHADVVEYLDSGKFIEDLDDMYDEDLECISPWGTEPSLTLDIFTKWMPVLLEKFPKLNSFTFSSNFMRHPKYLVEFLDSLPKDREFVCRIQYSLDGPKWITDVTRHKNATKIICKNVKTFFEEAVKADFGELNIHVNCKPTWDDQVIAQVGNDISLVEDYLSFFNTFFGEIDEILKGSDPEKICHAKVNCPFLALPGHYSQEHGILWAKINDELYRFQHLHRTEGLFPHLSREFTAYQPRFQRILDYGREFYTKPEMFSCSAGDTQFGIDHKRNLHACHRTFYLCDDNYVNSIKHECDNGNWDLAHYQNDRLDDIRNNMMASIDDEDACFRFVYNTSGHHYFIQGKLNIIASLTMLLAHAGQASPIYKDETAARLLAEFIATAFNCSVEYNLTLGNYNLVPVGLIKLCANGMFESILRNSTGGWDRHINEWYKL